MTTQYTPAHSRLRQLHVKLRELQNQKHGVGSRVKG